MRVTRAARTMEMLDMVPVSGLYSNALEVPVPCALVPKAIPLAISPSIFSHFTTLGPISSPVRPVMTTKTAVICGIPSIIVEMSIAIGVVME